MRRLVFFGIIFTLYKVSYLISSCSPCYEQVSGEWAHKTLAKMTVREKIGQLFMVATTASFEQSEEALAASLVTCPYRMDRVYISTLIEEYKIGGLIFLYKSSPDLQIDAVNKFQARSTVPLLIGQDCEWGLAMRLNNTIRFPRNMTLGAIQNKELIYQLGKEIGKECKAMGIHINFSPVADVNNNKYNPVIHDRSFGDDPDSVATSSLLMMRGLQEERILACGKHFPGHGDTQIDSHLKLPVILSTLDKLKNCELLPFKKLIVNGIAAIMSGHLAVPALEKNSIKAATLSYLIITDFLEKELNFNGLKITDGLGMKALSTDCQPGELELHAFLAGNDILLCPLDVPYAIDLIEQAVIAQKISIDDLDKRVLKVLKAKEWTGCHAWKPIDKKEALQKLSSENGYLLKE